jgi:hypothetical protein
MRITAADTAHGPPPALAGMAARPGERVQASQAGQVPRSPWGNQPGGEKRARSGGVIGGGPAAELIGDDKEEATDRPGAGPALEL